MSAQLYLIMASALLGIGVFGLVVGSSHVHRSVSLNVATVGVLTAMVALASRSTPADPVTHAMVLTGLVVAVSASALALAIVRREDELDEESS